MEPRHRVPRIELRGDGPKKLLRRIRTTRQILGMQHIELELQTLGNEQGMHQQLGQGRERRMQLPGGHFQEIQRLQGERSGVVAPTVGVHVTGEVGDAREPPTSQKKTMLDEVGQARPALRLMKAARGDAASQRDPRGLRIMQQRDLHTILQVQCAPRYGWKVGVHIVHCTLGSLFRITPRPRQSNPTQVPPEHYQSLAMVPSGKTFSPSVRPDKTKVARFLHFGTDDSPARSQ
ncbi:hypothetical protein D3C78_847650 [compost metagenome]